MSDFKMTIELTPPDHDSDNVRFMIGKKQVGFGYKAKDSGKIHIQICPKCDRENYAMAMATGYCAFCKFNPNL